MNSSGTPGLEEAVALAALAHRGQLDKAGNPYILHPLRVMLRVRDAVERIAAVLHDVVEDTEVTLETLRQHGYSEQVLSIVDAVTRRDGETYAEFIERIAPNGPARRVKLADLADNMDLSRLPEVREKDLQRMERYRAAWARLTSLEGE